MCWIPKVASSTWIAHFAKIQDGKLALTQKNDFIFLFIETDGNKRELKSKIEKAPKNVDELKEIWNNEENLSMVVVRHPLSRLGEQ